jgi:hypothetical protein
MKRKRLKQATKRRNGALYPLADNRAINGDCFKAPKRIARADVAEELGAADSEFKRPTVPPR